MSKILKKLFSVFCRMVGPGGTTVDFYATTDGIEAVWTNENCPYDYAGSGVTRDEHDRADDNHNVDKSIRWDELEDALALAIKKGWYEPKKLRRSNG